MNNRYHSEASDIKGYRFSLPPLAQIVLFIDYVNLIQERGQDVENSQRKNIGMERLIQKYKAKFETEENINYYSYKDFVKAERKYLKYVLEGSFDVYGVQFS